MQTPDIPGGITFSTMENDMTKDQWITISAERLAQSGCVKVKVTGGKYYDIIEDPDVDKSGMNAAAHVQRYFVTTGRNEKRSTLKTKKSDLEFWHH